MAKVVKDSLQSLIQGVPRPTIPSFPQEWDLERTKQETRDYLHKLDDYLRRLMNPLTGNNILNEILQQAPITLIQQFITSGGGGSSSTTEYGFGPVKIDVYADCPYNDDGINPVPFGGSFIGTIKTSTLNLSQIDYYPGIGSNAGLDDPSHGRGKCKAVRISCKAVPDFSENYTFSVTTDDGHRLYLNGSLADDNWSTIPLGPTSGLVVAATAGVPISIVLEVVNNGGTNFDSVLLWHSSNQTGGVNFDILYGNLRSP